MHTRLPPCSLSALLLHWQIILHRAHAHARDRLTYAPCPMWLFSCMGRFDRVRSG
jgi:hypothetical protein